VVLPKARFDRQKGVGSLVWDNASWHISHEVRQWIDEHNRAAKKKKKKKKKKSAKGV
jgi:hypothetical protein